MCRKLSKLFEREEIKAFGFLAEQEQKSNP
jgi:hypothetical protein